MFTDIKDAIEFIESRRHKHTIEEYRKILEKLKINMKQPGMIHIAGTNGKGSTVNYLRSLFNEHGYHVGTFTSPYLTVHNDRIRIDDENISDEDLLAYINKYYDVIIEEDLSMFEIDVLIMLDYFNTRPLDYRIIECGIGGKNDKTNVIDPIISAITNIGEDHLELIGPGLFDVINEKMGIIKPGQIFITTEISGTVLARLQEECDVQGVRMVVVPEYEVTHYPYTFEYRQMSFTLENQGIYQIQNARLALTIASKCINLNETKTKKAIEQTSWKGRYEILKYNGKQVILDGAHNKPGIEALVKSIKTQNNGPFPIIFACLKDKDENEMIELINQTNYPIYLTSFYDDRINDLENKIIGNNMKYIKDYKDAIKTASILYDKILVTGSLHFISTVRSFLTK